MIKLYFAPRTRSVRILWLLEELDLDHELEHVEFLPPAKNFFAQATPMKKLPTIEDGEVVICESGAIVEYILECYGEGRLAPPIGSPNRPAYLQWLHFSEATAFPPVGIVVWLSRYRDEKGEVLEDARGRAASTFEFMEEDIGDRDYLVGNEFTAADIMMGFTLMAASVVGVFDDRFPKLQAYLGRLTARPAFQKAAST